jgi:GGDEF domain-containing protein
MTVFLLSLLAMVYTGPRLELAAAACVAIVCGALTWAAAEQAFGRIDDAVDRLSERLAAAVDGDLMSPPPEQVRDTLPELAGAMETLFAQVRSDLDSVHALALFDPVTTLPNRLNFRREAERMIAQAGGDEQAALLFIDLDRFKAVNDSLGHAEGDRLLLMVANRLLQVLARPEPADGSIVARLAGDEFTFFSTGGCFPLWPSRSIWPGTALISARRSASRSIPTTAAISSR